MYLFISALFSFSFTNTNIHLKFLITIILYIESSRGFLMWAVQSPGRRLRPLVYFWVVLSGIWNASGLHCGAMRTAHIKNPDWGGGFGCIQFYRRCSRFAPLTPAYNKRKTRDAG